MAAMSVQSVLSKCPLTALQAHNHKSPKLIQQCNNASSRWGLNNITQPDIDSLFAAIVLPKITYGLSVYAASPPDLNTVDLVPRSRFGGSRTKNRGRGEEGGEGRGGNEIWQNTIAWARIWPTRQLRML